MNNKTKINRRSFLHATAAYASISGLSVGLTYLLLDNPSNNWAGQQAPSAPQVDAAVFSANFLNRVDGVNRAKMALEMQYLLTISKTGKFTAPELIREVTEFRKTLEADPDYEKLAAQEIDNFISGAIPLAGQAFSILEKLNKADPKRKLAASEGYKALSTLFDKTLGRSLDGVIDGNRQIDELIHNSTLAVRAGETITSIASQLAISSRDNRALTIAANAIFEPTLQAKVNDNATAILAKNPDTKAYSQIEQLLTGTGEIKAGLGELQKLVEKGFTDLTSLVNSSNQKLDEVINKENAILAGVGQILANEKAKRENEEQAAKNKETAKGIQSGLFLLSTLIGFSDPKLARQVSVVANSGIAIANTLNDFIKTAGKIGLAVINPLSAITLVADVVGAVLNIVGLFGPASPSPEEMIQKQIGELQKQVQELGEYMQARFDAIDKALNAIYSELATKFSEIKFALGKIQTDINAIHNSIIEQRSRLITSESTLLGAIRDLSQIDLNEKIEIAFSAKAKGIQLAETEFRNLESAFFTWTTRSAFSKAVVQPDKKSIVDRRFLAEELDNYPLHQDVNWLVALSESRWKPQMRPIPNLDVWVRSANAYLMLLVDWPQLSRNQFYRDRLLQVIAIGRQMQSALSTISAQSLRRANKPLFSALIKRYELDIANTFSEAEKNRDAWVKEQEELFGLNPLQIDKPQILESSQSFQNLVKRFGKDVISKLTDNEIAALLLGLINLRHQGTNQKPQVIGTESCTIRVNKGYEVVDVPVSLTISDIELFVKFPDEAEANFGKISAQLVSYTCPPFNPSRPAQTTIVDSQIHTSFDETLRLRIERSVQDRLREFPYAWNSKIFARMSNANDPLFNEIRFMAGSSALLLAFLVAGFPNAISHNDLLRSYINGKNTLLADNANRDLTNIYRSASDLVNATASERSSTIESLVGKPFALDYELSKSLREEAVKRVNELKALLEDYFLKIEDGSYSEEFDLISATVSRLVGATLLYQA